MVPLREGLVSRQSDREGREVFSQGGTMRPLIADLDADD